MSEPSVDIITVNFNCGAFLPAYFEALAQLEYPRDRYRVVMVDNASTDGSFGQLGLWQGRVSVEGVALTQNLGVTAGNNAGIRRATGQYLALLNPDTRVESDWLSVMVDRLEREPEVGLVEARQIPCPLDKYYDPATGDTSWASTGGVLLRREALDQAGLFDERFFMYEDDVDLSWRLWLSGWRCVYEPTSAYHHRPHDERGNTGFLRYYVVRNQLFMRYIYGSPRSFVDRLWLGVKYAARDRRHDLRIATLRAIHDAVVAVPWLRRRRAALPRVDCSWVGLFQRPYAPRSLSRPEGNPQNSEAAISGSIR